MSPLFQRIDRIVNTDSIAVVFEPVENVRQVLIFISRAGTTLRPSIDIQMSACVKGKVTTKPPTTVSTTVATTMPPSCADVNKIMCYKDGARICAKACDKIVECDDGMDEPASCEGKLYLLTLIFSSFCTILNVFAIIRVLDRSSSRFIIARYVVIQRKYTVNSGYNEILGTTKFYSL